MRTCRKTYYGASRLHRDALQIKSEWFTLQLSDAHGRAVKDSSADDIFTRCKDIDHRSIIREACFSVVDVDHTDSQNSWHSCGRRCIGIDTMDTRRGLHDPIELSLNVCSICDYLLLRVPPWRQAENSVSRPNFESFLRRYTDGGGCS